MVSKCLLQQGAPPLVDLASRFDPAQSPHPPVKCWKNTRAAQQRISRSASTSPCFQSLGSTCAARLFCWRTGGLADLAPRSSVGRPPITISVISNTEQNLIKFLYLLNATRCTYWLGCGVFGSEIYSVRVHTSILDTSWPQTVASAQTDPISNRL